MTEIIFDYADIASRMKNPNQIFPKVESDPHHAVVTLPELPTLMAPIDAYRRYIREMREGLALQQARHLREMQRNGVYIAPSVGANGISVGGSYGGSNSVNTVTWSIPTDVASWVSADGSTQVCMIERMRENASR